MPVPKHSSFSLVGNSNGCYLTGSNTLLLYNFPGYPELGFPYQIGIVFYPSGLRINLFEFLVGNGYNLTGMVKQDSAVTGGS
jgi:hypothetical protein